MSASLAIGAILASPLPASALQPPDGITVDVPGSLQKMLTTVGAPASGTSPATGLFAQHVYRFLDTATLNAALMSARTAGNFTDSCLNSGQIARFEALTMSNGDKIPIRKAFSINASKMADYVEAFYKGSKLLT